VLDGCSNLDYILCCVLCCQLRRGNRPMRWSYHAAAGLCLWLQLDRGNCCNSWCDWGICHTLIERNFFILEDIFFFSHCFWCWDRPWGFPWYRSTEVHPSSPQKGCCIKRNVLYRHKSTIGTAQNYALLTFAILSSSPS